MRKSAKFTAAQNKQQRSQFIDSIGELVEYCQKYGNVIPRIKIDVQRDIVDQVINDLKSYNRTLIYQDTALARQIEDYLKKRQYIEQNKQDLAEAKAKGLNNVQLTDKDLQEYNQYIQDQKQKDNTLLEGGQNK